MIEHTMRDAKELARAFYEELHPGVEWMTLGYHEQLPFIDAAYSLLKRGKIMVGHDLFVGAGR